MSMNEFRRLAAKMDQHMQQLSAQGINDEPNIINRMMGYVPELHKIWVGTTDEQLMALSNAYPGFYRYALAMENASEAERNKPSRPYDGIPQFSEKHQHLGAQLLTTAATLERRYQALSGSDLSVVQAQINDIDKLYQQWLADLDSFKSALRAQDADPRVLEYVNAAFGRLAERIKVFAS